MRSHSLRWFLLLAAFVVLGAWSLQARGAQKTPAAPAAVKKEKAQGKEKVDEPQKDQSSVLDKLLRQILEAVSKQKDKSPPPGTGWEAFWKEEGKFVLEILVSLCLSAVLGFVIAYHPKTWGKAATLEEFDQPKIFIMYAIVGSIVAEIVRAYPEMAFVIFGIGGLLRFRTDVGPARDTGRVILATLVGLCCGLQIYTVALLSTTFGWVVIYLLESQVTHRVIIKGIDKDLLAEAAEAYEEVLVENSLRVMSQKKNFVKGQVAFVFRAPGRLDREQLEGMFKDIPPKLQGAPDWESA